MQLGAPRERIRLLVCPLDPRLDQPQGQGAVNLLSYTVNCGLRDRGWNSLSVGRDGDQGGGYLDTFQEPIANGVFHNNYVRGTGAADSRPRYTYNSLDQISEADGTTCTLMVSENLDATYWPGGSSPWSLDVSEGTVGFCWTARTGEAADSQERNGMRINFAAGKYPGRAPRPSGAHDNGVNVIFCDAHSAFISNQVDWLTWCLLHTPDGSATMVPARGGYRDDSVLKPFRTTPLEEKF